MSTKKDLVEAHAFSRRRLVTAFVSGAPGGREVEPSRPGRTIVGGVALGVLVLAGGAIAGVFSGRPPEGWLDPGLVASGGSLYAITEESDDPELRPVDPVSGRLIFGSEVEPSEVSTEEVATQRTGGQIGIRGAPSALPPVDLLIDEGWTSCTAPGGGIRTDVADPPLATPADGAGLVVTTGDATWLIAYGEVVGDPAPQAFRYRVPNRASSAILGELDPALPSTEIPVVDEDWLNLWTEGRPLTAASFEDGDGGRAPVDDEIFEGLDGDLRLGDTVDLDGLPYLVTPDGPAPLDEFARAVYRTVGDGRERSADGLAPGVDTVRGTPDGWPTAAPTSVSDDSMCAMLVPRVDERPTVVIADGFEGQSDLEARAEEAAESDEGAPAEDEVTVQEGRGAFFLSGTESPDVALPFVLDARGVQYLVEGQDAIEALGYGGHDARLVPDSWLELFGCGVALSRNAALSTPDQTAPREDC